MSVWKLSLWAVNLASGFPFQNWFISIVRTKYWFNKSTNKWVSNSLMIAFHQIQDDIIQKCCHINKILLNCTFLFSYKWSRLRHIWRSLVNVCNKCYFRHKRARTGTRVNHRRSASQLDSFRTWNNLRSLSGLKPAPVRAEMNIIW
jgi:hypothetical protein